MHREGRAGQMVHWLRTLVDGPDLVPSTHMATELPLQFQGIWHLLAFAGTAQHTVHKQIGRWNTRAHKILIYAHTRIYTVCVCVCALACAAHTMACMWSSKDSLGESALPFTMQAPQIKLTTGSTKQHMEISKEDSLFIKIKGKNS